MYGQRFVCLFFTAEQSAAGLGLSLVAVQPFIPVTVLSGPTALMRVMQQVRGTL
jgi:hypothetical protein